MNVGPAFFDFDNQRLFLYSARGRDKMAFVRIDPAKPDDEELIYANDVVDLDGVGYSHQRKVLTAASYQTDKLHLHFFDDATRKSTTSSTRSCPATRSICRPATRTRTSSSSPP